MIKSRPLFLIVVTLCLLLVVVASYWLALMPQRSLRSLQTAVKNSSGHSLEAKSARIDIFNGFDVILDEVTITDAVLASWQLSAKSIRISGLVDERYRFEQAVIDVDVSAASVAALNFSSHMTFVDGIAKLRDPSKQSVVAITDINGEVFSDTDNRLQGQLAMVWGSHISDLNFTIESLERFLGSGSPIDVTFKSNDSVFGFSGQGRMDKGLKLAGQATTESKDLGTFFRWIGLPIVTLNGAGPFSAQSGFSAHGLALTFDALAGKVDDTDVKGRFTIEAGSDRPKLSGELNAAAVSLWGPKLGDSILSVPWSEKPISFSDLAAVDFDVALKMDRLNLRGREFGTVLVQLLTEADRLKITVAEQKIAGGIINLQASLKKSGEQLGLEAVMTASQVPAQSFFGGLAGFDFLEGAFDIRADLKSTGQSIAGLISSLGGKAALKSDAATLKTIDMKSLLSKPQAGWNPVETTQTDKAKIDMTFSISEGVATLGKSTIGFADISLKPKGEIDLLRQALSVQLMPKGGNIDTKMEVTGQWIKPAFSVDTIFTEKTPVTPPAN